MSKRVSDVMTKQPVCIASTQSVSDAARQMSNNDVGAVIVEEANKATGILTDRDIAVRVVAEGRDPSATSAAEVCSRDLTTVSPSDDLDRALQLMRNQAIRRILVVDSSQRAVGMLSLGDLALSEDSRSVLGEISAAPPNG